MSPIGGKKTGVSVTLALVISFAITFLVGWAQPNNPWTEALMFNGTLSKPWTALTYPWAPLMSSPIWFLIGLVFLYSYGMILESKLGPALYFGAFLVFTLMGAVGGAVAKIILPGAPIQLIGDFIPAICVAIAAVASMRMPVNFWGITIPPHIFAILLTVFVVLGHGYGNPLVGVLVAAPCLFAWVWGGSSQLSGSSRGIRMTGKHEDKKARKEFLDYMDNVKTREQERDEQERLRKLFESSVEEDEQK